MKNKTLKNLIFLGALFVVFAISINYTEASYYNNGYRESVINLNDPIIPNINTSIPVAYNYSQQLPYTYVQQPVQYIEQPTPATSVQYIPQTVKTVPTTSTKTVTATTAGTSKTGDYVNYDGNSLGASAYNSQGLMPLQSNDNNDLTALSVNGSGSFMPSSVFQWIVLILLVFAIVVVARILYKKITHRDTHGVIH